MLLLHIDNDDDDNDNNNSNDNDDDDAARKKIGKTVGPSRRQRPFDFKWQKRVREEKRSALTLPPPDWERAGVRWTALPRNGRFFPFF